MLTGLTYSEISIIQALFAAGATQVSVGAIVWFCQNCSNIAQIGRVIRRGCDDGKIVCLRKGEEILIDLPGVAQVDGEWRKVDFYGD